MKPLLPQNDPNPENRKDWLSRNREEYQFNFDYLPPLPLIDDVPNGEAFSPKYLAERLPVTLGKLSANTLGIKLRSFWDPFDEFQDYEDFFPVLPAPKLLKTYQNDEYFAEQRLSGANPMVLRSMKAIPSHFAFTIQDLQNEFGSSLNLEQELKDGNLYIADYTSLSFVRGGSYLRGRKSLPAPIAIFCWRRSGYCDRGELTPIAIQLVPELGTKSRILTPFDSPLNWLYAKICVQIADANHHEMSSHLCHTHLVMEPFAIVTARQLGESHPLGLLLRPHFRFMLYNNELARNNLINQGGFVDDLLAGTLRESLQIVREAYFKNAQEYWSLDGFALPNEIKNRGLDDVEHLPHYPYRDDGMLLWDAIEKFVSNYLSIYYPNPEDVREDYELQAWARELVASDAGRVKGVPERIDNLQQLINIVTAIIFTCGPQHSAVNYPQYEYMTFVPNMPLAGYQSVEPNPSIDLKGMMAFLPPPNQAAEQLQILYGLAAYRYDRLGYYDRPFTDPRAEEVVRLFQQDLNHIERQIELRNKHRLVEYDYLKPSLVLNSISI